MDPRAKYDAHLLHALAQVERIVQHSVIVNQTAGSGSRAADLATAYALRRVSPTSFSGRLNEIELELLAAHPEIKSIKLVQTLSPSPAMAGSSRKELGGV